MSSCGSKTSAWPAGRADAADLDRRCRSRPPPRGRWSPPGPAPATQPLPSMPRPQAVPSTRTTLRARRRARRGAARIPASGAGTSAAGPRTAGSGSKRASALRIGPDGGSSWLSSRRIAERWMSARSGGEPEDWSATAPTIHAIPRPDARGQRRARAAPSTVRRPGSRSAERACTPMPSKPAGQHPARQQRAEQAEQRRVLRVRAAGQHQRRQPRADERAEREADQRQRADDEALHVAVERQQRA